jgi:hypothetical protein
VLEKNVSREKSRELKDLADLSLPVPLSRSQLSPDPYLQSLSEVVVLRRALLTAYPDVKPPLGDDWQHVPGIVRERADAGKGIPPNYPEYPSQQRQYTDVPYVPVALPDLRREIEEIRTELLEEHERLSRFNRLTHLVDIIASNVRHAIESDREVFPPIEVFVERNADLINSLSMEFLEILEPTIETLGGMVFELSTERLSVKDIARRFGIDANDPRFPDYLRGPVTLQEATSKIRQFFTINDASSPLHRAAVGTLMLLEQLPLIRQRYLFESPNSPLFTATDLDEVEDRAEVEILESQPRPYSVAGQRKLSEFLRIHDWWNEGINRSETREMVQKAAELFIHSSPVYKRYGADVIDELCSGWKAKGREPLSSRTPHILTSVDLVSCDVDDQKELERHVLSVDEDAREALFQNRSFQSLALLSSADPMIIRRAIEMFSDVREILGRDQSAANFCVSDLIRPFLGKTVSQLEQSLYEHRPRYSRQVSAQELQERFTLEHYVSATYRGRLSIEDRYKEYPLGDLTVLAVEVSRLLRAGQWHTPSMALTQAIMTVVHDSWHLEKYGESDPREWSATPGEHQHPSLSRVLYVLFALRHGLPDERLLNTSFAPEAAMATPANYQGVERLRYWLQHSLPGILKKESDVAWVVDLNVQRPAGTQASLFECLSIHMGGRENPHPISLAEMILAFQMSKYVATIASDASTAHVIAQQRLLPEQRWQIFSHMIENPSPARSTISASLRAVAQGLGSRVSYPEVFEEFKRAVPIERLAEIGIGVDMLERDLAIQPSALDFLRVEPGLLPWDEEHSNVGASEPTPSEKFLTSVDALGDFDLWAPFVSVKQALKLERAFAHATGRPSGVTLLREFLHASHRLKVSWGDDSRLAELVDLPPEGIVGRYRALLKEARHTLATIPSQLTLSNPLDAILVSEALGRSRAPTRLPTVDILALHEWSRGREGVSALPECITRVETTLPVRRKQRESLRPGSSFLKLFEFCDLVGTKLHGPPAEYTPEIKRLLNSPTVRLLQTLETRHFSIRNHDIDSDTFAVARDNLVYAHHVMEALFDSVNGASGDSTWAGQPDIKRKIWEELDFDSLLQEIDSCFAEYQALPETKKQRVIEFVPTRGVLMEFAGDICGTCVSRLNFIAENVSESFFVPFVRGGKVNDTGNVFKRLEGGAFVFRGRLDDGRPTFVIRGFNPSHSLIHEVSVGALFEKFADCVAAWGTQEGISTVSIPADDFWGNALTNRRYAFLYLRNRYSTRTSVALSLSQVSCFNDCPVSHVKVVRG